MSDLRTPELPITVSSYSLLSAMAAMRARQSFISGGALTWVADLAMFIPVTLPWHYPVERVFWANGGTITSNVDFGIYAEDGTRIYSTGEVAQAGATDLQFVTPADPFLLPPGAYYFALACDGTTSRLNGSTSVNTNWMRLAGVLQQAAASPLPANMNGAGGPASTLWPICGITRLQSGV